MGDCELREGPLAHTLTQRAKDARFNRSSVKKRARPPYEPNVSDIIATPPANFTAMIDVPVTIGRVVRVLGIPPGIVRSMMMIQYYLGIANSR